MDNMDAHHEFPKDAAVHEVDQCQCEPRKEGVVEQKNLPLLAAYRAKTLTVEAAQELVRMLEDQSIPAHAGEDLPTADKAALLRKAARLQESR